MNFHLFKKSLSSIILITMVGIITNLRNEYFLVFLIFIYFVSSYEWIKLSKNKFILLLGLLFLAFSTYSVFEIKSINNNNNLFYFLLIVCVGSDVGGFSFGKVLGGPKLTSISPNKTFSGSIGSFILAIFFSYIYLDLIKFDILNANAFNLKYFFLIFLLSLVCQLGDLVISFFKRKSKLKDTSNLIPGHGGLLDRIDGILFVFPFFYTLSYFLNF